MNNLIQDLKCIGCLADLPFNFEDWKICNENQQDSLHTLRNDNSLQFTNNHVCNQRDNDNENIQVAWKGEHKRLCIIINEMNFLNEQVR